MTMLYLCCRAGFCLDVASGGYSLVVVASPASEQRLWGKQASVVVAHGLSCSLAYRIFLDQGLNLCLLHWQVDSLPLSH